MANKALFLKVSEIKKKSIISGNLDPDKIIQYIARATLFPFAKSQKD